VSLVRAGCARIRLGPAPVASRDGGGARGRQSASRGSIGRVFTGRTALSAE
jgi:hypothetical protein